MEAKKIDISDYEKSKAKYQKLLLTEVKRMRMQLLIPMTRC